MSYAPNARGGYRAKSRPATSDRHWGHWRWLLSLPQARYARAIALWHRLYHVRPRGIAVDGAATRLNFIRGED